MTLGEEEKPGQAHAHSEIGVGVESTSVAVVNAADQMGEIGMHAAEDVVGVGGAGEALVGIVDREVGDYKKVHLEAEWGRGGGRLAW